MATPKKFNRKKNIRKSKQIKMGTRVIDSASQKMLQYDERECERWTSAGSGRFFGPGDNDASDRPMGVLQHAACEFT